MEISFYLHNLERTHPTTAGISEFLNKIVIGPQVYKAPLQFLVAGVLGICYCAINNGDLWSMMVSFVCTMVIFGFRRIFIQAGMNFYASALLGLVAGVTLAVFLAVPAK